MGKIFVVAPSYYHSHFCCDCDVGLLCKSWNTNNTTETLCCPVIQFSIYFSRWRKFPYFEFKLLSKNPKFKTFSFCLQNLKQLINGPYLAKQTNKLNVITNSALISLVIDKLHECSFFLLIYKRFSVGNLEEVNKAKHHNCPIWYRK